MAQWEPSNLLTTYLKQYLQTASDGNVSYECALLERRLKFICSKCGATQACDAPEDTTLDYVVQEFVKLHSHRPGHESLFAKQQAAKQVAIAQETCNHSSTAQTGVNSGVVICMRCQKTWPVASKVPFKPIDPSGKAVIDKDPLKQQQIQDAVEKYKTSMEQKLIEQEAKIKQLQQQADIAAQQAKAKSYPGKIISVSDDLPGFTWVSPNAWGGAQVQPNGTVTLPSAGTITIPPPAPNNIIPFPAPDLGNGYEWNGKWYPHPDKWPQTPPPPTPEPPKALKPKTGRRFR